MFGDRLQELRVDKGMSQKDLSGFLGISWHTVSSYETNRSVPNDEIKIKIARLFNVSIDYLVGYVDDPISHIVKEHIAIPPDLSPELKEDLKDYVQYLSLKNKGLFKNNSSNLK